MLLLCYSMIWVIGNTYFVRWSTYHCRCYGWSPVWLVRFQIIDCINRATYFLFGRIHSSWTDRLVSSGLEWIPNRKICYFVRRSFTFGLVHTTLQICCDRLQTVVLRIIRKFSNYLQSNVALCNSRCDLLIMWGFSYFSTNYCNASHLHLDLPDGDRRRRHVQVEAVPVGPLHGRADLQRNNT